MVSAVLCRPGGVYDGMVQKVWLHMQRTAPLARRLAPAFEVDAETAYALGLLHDVGKLVTFDHISQLRHALHREIQMPEPFLAALLAHLHEPLGGLAALRWGMDTEAAGVIAGHHRRTAPPIPSRLAELIYVAERLDLVLQRYQELDWEAVWKDGAVTADVAAVQELMPSPEDQDNDAVPDP
jgi:HD-like signal output (HDOD) protein